MLGTVVETLVAAQPGGFLVVLRGQIDEQTQLTGLADRLEGTAVIDLELVTFVNSAGVAEWVRMLERLRARGVAIVLRRCSEAMVNQMNMGADVRKGAAVESFFLPYACRDCGHETSACLELAPHLAALRRLAVPPLPCPRCRGRMDFVELAERYLMFIEAP